MHPGIALEGSVLEKTCVSQSSYPNNLLKISSNPPNQETTGRSHVGMSPYIRPEK